MPLLLASWIDTIITFLALALSEINGWYEKANVTVNVTNDINFSFENTVKFCQSY